MGQHRTNPVALAAKRGDISKADRQPVAKTGGGTMRSVLDIVGIGNRRPYVADGHGTIRLRHPKLRGKAAVKRAKRARQAVRQQEAA